ncbi:permease [Elusimicrobiota bacterium]
MAVDPVCLMKVNEKTPLKLQKDGETYFFCSSKCMEEYAQKNKIVIPECNSCSSINKKNWYSNKVTIISAILLFMVMGSGFLDFLIPFKNSLFLYLGKIWWAVLLGLVLGGVIDHFIPREYISHVLSKPRKRTVFYAAVLGFLMSACSHGILAISIELYKKGASVSAVIAFLLASPWANIPLTLMLVSFFGLEALYIILSAMIVAVITGFVYQFFESTGIIDKNPNSVEVKDDFSIFADIKRRVEDTSIDTQMIIRGINGVARGAVSLSNMVLWWILLGIGLASLTAAYVPSHIFHNYMGASFLGLMATLALATVLEVCSEGTAPLAFEIYRNTQALGNVYVFLMGGVVTDYTEIGILWSNINKKTAVLLPLITVPQVVVLGVLGNIFFV